jgi:hypothetical protein
MASWLLLNYNKRLKTSVRVELIINTVATGGINVSSHEGFKVLQSFDSSFSSFVCSYICEPITINANLYIWLNGDIPIIAYRGTTVFEQNAFLEKTNGNLPLCDASDAWEQYQTVVNSSIYCNHSEIEEYIIIYQIPPTSAISVRKEHDSLGSQSGEVYLPLVTKRTGEPGIHSGLNWGQRKGRNPNEAYIPLPVKIAKSGFFPVEPIDAPPHFSVVTDDKRYLILRIEQQNQKAITTPLSNAQLGEYFRNRMKLANGAKVTRADLEKYGRIDVRFVKIDGEHFYMDFSA